MWPLLDNWEKTIAGIYIRKNFKMNYDTFKGSSNSSLDYSNYPAREIYESFFQGSYSYDFFINNCLLPEIMIPINEIASQMAMLNLEFFKDFEKYEKFIDKKTLNYKLNKKPNNYDNDHQFKRKLFTELLMTGRTIVVKTYEKFEVFYHVLINDTYKIIFDEEENKRYVYVDTKEKINSLENEECNDIEYITNHYNGMFFDLEDCWDIDWMNINGRELSPLELLWQDMGNLLGTKRELNKSIKNANVIQGVVFNARVGSNKKQEKKYNESLDELLKSGVSGATTISGENTSVQTWNRQSGLEKLPQVSESIKKKVTEYLGLPDGLIGQDNGRAKEELINLFFIRIQPKLDLLESEIAIKELTTKELKQGAEVKFNIDPLYRALVYKNIEFNIKKIQTNLLLPNEGRKLLGLPALNKEELEELKKQNYKGGNNERNTKKDTKDTEIGESTN